MITSYVLIWLSTSISGAAYFDNLTACAIAATQIMETSPDTTAFCTKDTHNE